MHNAKMEELQISLTNMHRRCQDECNTKLQGENSNVNYSRDKTHLEFPVQYLSTLNVQSLYEFLRCPNSEAYLHSRWQHAQNFGTEGVSILLHHESIMVQDIKNHNPHATVEHILVPRPVFWSTNPN